MEERNEAAGAVNFDNYYKIKRGLISKEKPAL